MTLFVFHREAAAFPNICPTSATGRPAGSLLKGIVIPLRVSFDWSRFTDETA